jgi:hypothetical protein
MSDIHSAFNACMFKDTCGSNANKLMDAKQKIADLESQLAEAKKDQARYCETVKLYISGDLPLELDTAESKKEFDVSIDAAIASIQEGK